VMQINVVTFLMGIAFTSIALWAFGALEFVAILTFADCPAAQITKSKGASPVSPTTPQ
jgi:hypothetical protein